MKQFIYHGPTTSATIYGNEVVLADGKEYYMDANSPLVAAMIERGQLVPVGYTPAEPAADEPVVPAAPAAPATEPAAEPSLEESLKAEISKLKTKAQLVAAIQKIQPEFEPAKLTNVQLAHMLFDMRMAAEPAADEPAPETETN